MTDPVSPSTFEVRSARTEVRVTWEDGHESVYSFKYLRGFCPCAECQGHAAGWTFQDHPSSTIVSVKEVGSYAVNIVWDDGGSRQHATGIYPFDTLRKLCPCDACVEAQGARHAVHEMPEAQRP